MMPSVLLLVCNERAVTLWIKLNAVRSNYSEQVCNLCRRTCGHILVKKLELIQNKQDTKTKVNDQHTQSTHKRLSSWIVV